jgi:transposase
MRKELSSFTRGRIIGQHESDKAAQEIDDFLSIPQSTIRSVIKKYEEKDVKVPSPRSGRPSKLSKTDATALVLGVKRNPQEQFGYHQTTLVQANIEVCLNTVKKYLKEMGYGSYSMVHKPLLTSVHKRNRRHWAMEHKDWTLDQWKSVIWSDKSLFTVMGNDSFRKVIRKEGERYQERYIMPIPNFGKGSVMVWGCFWSGGYSPLVTMKGSVDQAVYIKCLEDHLLPWSENVKEEEKTDFIFQEDGATCHTGCRDELRGLQYDWLR